MASRKDQSGSPGRGGGQRKRPVEPRPIELEATEVREDRPADAAPAEEPAEDGSPASPQDQPSESSASPPAGADALAQAEQGAAEEAAHGAGEDLSPGGADDGSSDQEPPKAAAPKRGLAPVAGLFAAAIGGGIVVVLAVLALAMAGIWPPAGDTGLRTALEETQSRVASLEEAGPDVPAAADPEAVDQLAERVDALAARFDNGATAPGLSDLEERIATVEAQARAAVPAEDFEAALSEVGTRVDDLAGALSGLAEGAAPDPQLTQRLSELETAFAEDRGGRQELTARIDSLEGRLAEATAAADRQLARVATAAVALGGLVRAVEAGRPYEAELAALRPLIDDPQAIDALSTHAEVGLPTTAGLAERFAERTTAILGAGEDDAEPGFVGRITEVAGSLVRVRPAGPMEGDHRAAVVSRIEAALAEGDVDAAYQEWQGLDQQARAAAADFGEALATRRAGEGELAALSSHVTAALAPPPASPD